MDPLNRCSVCGFEGLEEPPASAATGAGSYEICPSCGFQFGVTDLDGGHSYFDWREAWIARGMPFDAEPFSVRPDGWDPAAQLLSLGEQ